MRGSDGTDFPLIQAAVGPRKWYPQQRGTMSDKEEAGIEYMTKGGATCLFRRLCALMKADYDEARPPPQSQYMRCIRALVKHGAVVTAMDVTEARRSALLWACERQHYAAIVELLAQGADRAPRTGVGEGMPPFEVLGRSEVDDGRAHYHFPAEEALSSADQEQSFLRNELSEEDYNAREATIASFRPDTRQLYEKARFYMREIAAGREDGRGAAWPGAGR